MLLRASKSRQLKGLWIRKNQGKQIQAWIRAIPTSLEFLSDPLWHSLDSGISWDVWVQEERKGELGSPIQDYST